jgi:hypothetical protein
MKLPSTMAYGFFFKPYSCSMEIDLTYIGFEVATLPSQKCVVKNKNLHFKIKFSIFSTINRVSQNVACKVRVPCHMYTLLIIKIEQT